MGEWISTSDAAQILGVTTRRITQLIAEGELIAQRVGIRVWLVNRGSVYRYDVRRQR